jgi:hypothetical protein
VAEKARAKAVGIGFSIHRFFTGVLDDYCYVKVKTVSN